MMRWTKVGTGVWVDSSAFYCIRWRSPGHSYEDFPGQEVYEASETWPGLEVAVIAVRPHLPGAKLACQKHFAGTIVEPAGVEEAA